MQVLPFLNNPKDLDPSYKIDLDFFYCFGREKNPSYNGYPRNMVCSSNSKGMTKLQIKWGIKENLETIFLF